MTKKESVSINRNPTAETVIFKIQAYLEAIEKNALCYKEKNFELRMEALDFIEFEVIDQLETLLLKTAQSDKLMLLKHRAEKIKAQLEEIDANLFQKLQANISMEKYTGKEFKNLINKYVDFNFIDNKHPQEVGYDNLDLFINGLFPLQTMPQQTKDLEPEMVFYQKTPARIVFELVEKAQFIKEDVFFDLGSGLGQVAILVNLLAKITVRGIEFEPAFCNYAINCVTTLNLSNVTFVNIDARKANYTEGTVFFMFTPFKGDIMQEVLAILRKQSQQRKIKIITYGSCTTQVALQNWLHFEAPKDSSIYKLGVFTSL